MATDDRQPTDQFRSLSIEAGDIVIVLGRPSNPVGKLKQSINVLGQRALVKLRASDPVDLLAPLPKHSHVMLGVGDGLIIHADGKTVALEVLSDALHVDRPDAYHYQVYRNKNISPETAAQVAKSAMRYFGQKYRFTSYLGQAQEGDTTQFCSRLVAHAYRAVDLPLTQLANNKVLPLDLYQILQTGDWVDVTEQFTEPPLPPESAALLGDIALPTGETVDLNTVFEKSNEAMLASMRVNRKVQELQYQHHKHALHTEALLAKYCALQFDMAKQVRNHPVLLNNDFAASVARVLSQLKTLLDIAELPSLDLLVPSSLLNTGDMEQDSPYVGMPPPAAIRELQTGREAITIYTYLLMAEVGMFTILRHAFGNDKFNQFQDVPPYFANSFLASLQTVTRRAHFESLSDTFAWVDEPADRALCQTIFHNLLVSLKVLEMARAG